MGCTNDYTYNYNVTSFDADQNRELTLSALLRIQQEAGEQHLNTGGLGYKFLHSMGIIFILTRAGTVIHRLPRFGDGEVCCKTWSNGFSGMLFTRSYTLTSADGELLAESASTFTAVDPNTFRLLRPGKLTEMDLPHHPELRNACPVPAKLRFSGDEGFVPALSRDITYSMIDYNGHLNNTKYADIIYDAYPDELWQNDIKSLNINFLGQALCGDIIDVECAELSGRYLFRAGHGRGQCFSAELCTARREQ